MEKLDTKELANFKLEESSSKSGSNNSNESKKSNNDSSINEIEPFKISLQTFESMQKDIKNISSNEIVYDLDEKTNFEFITNILEDKAKSAKSKISYFKDMMYKLSFKDRQYILKKHKKLFFSNKKKCGIIHKKKLKSVFISFLKSIIKGNPNTINQLFHTKYYVPIQSSKIPFIYGSEEYIFANLINDTYNTFIINFNYPKKTRDKSFDEKINLSNFINKEAIKPIINPIQVVETNNFTINDNYIKRKSNVIKQLKTKQKRNYYKFYQNKNLLIPILKLYCSTEFQKKYKQYLSEHPELKHDKKVKYVYEIIIEALYFYCLKINEVDKLKLIKEFKNIFYESENEKKQVLDFGIKEKKENCENDTEDEEEDEDDNEEEEKIKINEDDNMEKEEEEKIKADEDQDMKLEEEVKIYYDEDENMEGEEDEDNSQKLPPIKILDSNGKDFDFSNELKNKDYKVLIENNEFTINFYDYNVSSLFDGLCMINFDDISEEEKKKKIQALLNDPQYWTVQKHARENSPYNNKNLDTLFKNEINIMLKHKVLENIFNETPFGKEYKYPFLEKDFLNQVHDSIIYMKFPTKLLLGLTIKHMGIILINKDRYRKIINEEKDKNIKYILRLSEYSFYKTALLHQVNYHYLSVILFSNQKTNIINAPKIGFKNNKIDNESNLDFDDILFGKKLSKLYIRGIMNIITLDLWNNNNNDKKPKEMGKKFFEINKEVENDEIKIKDLINLSEFSKYLYEIIDYEKSEIPFELDKDIVNFFP